jgi:hypothetical protein
MDGSMYRVSELSKYITHCTFIPKGMTQDEMEKEFCSKVESITWDEKKKEECSIM